MILGDNGAGKSTLLRLLAGLNLSTRGTVQVFSEEPHGCLRRRIAYMSHEPMLYDELSALENLRYFAMLQQGKGIVCSCTASPEMALRAVGLDQSPPPPGGPVLAGHAATGFPWRACCRPTPSCCCWRNRSRISMSNRRTTWWSCCSTSVRLAGREAAAMAMGNGGTCSGTHHHPHHPPGASRRAAGRDDHHHEGRSDRK